KSSNFGSAFLTTSLGNSSTLDFGVGRMLALVIMDATSLIFKLEASFRKFLSGFKVLIVLIPAMLSDAMELDKDLVDGFWHLFTQEYGVFTAFNVHNQERGVDASTSFSKGVCGNLHAC